MVSDGTVHLVPELLLNHQTYWIIRKERLDLSDHWDNVIVNLDQLSDIVWLRNHVEQLHVFVLDSLGILHHLLNQSRCFFLLLKQGLQLQVFSFWFVGLVLELLYLVAEWVLLGHHWVPDHVLDDGIEVVPDVTGLDGFICRLSSALLNWFLAVIQGGIDWFPDCNTWLVVWWHLAALFHFTLRFGVRELVWLFHVVRNHIYWERILGLQLVGSVQILACRFSSINRILDYFFLVGFGWALLFSLQLWSQLIRILHQLQRLLGFPILFVWNNGALNIGFDCF